MSEVCACWEEEHPSSQTEGTQWGEESLIASKHIPA